MARLLTWGFETGAATSVNGWPDGDFNAAGAAATISSTVARSGGFSAKIDSGVGQSCAVDRGGASEVALTVSASNYARMYYRFDSLPNTDVQIMGVGNVPIYVKLTTAGKLQLWNGTSAQIGSDSAATIAADATTWYRIELSVTLNATPQITACELRLDGVSVASTTGLALATTTTQQWTFGWMFSPGASKVCYLDDGAINDSTGAAQNSWPGPGNVVLLKPTADSAVGTGWTGGAGGTTGLWDAVNNTPPTGATDPGTNASQIRNATSNANVNYDATMTTYTAAGVPTGATVNVVDAFVLTAAPVATGAKLGTVGVVSNPAITNINLAAAGTSGAFWQGNAAAAYPSGWKWSKATTTYAPSVTLGTAPVMEITQTTASTRIAAVCSMGVYVDYTPAAAAAAIPDVGMALTVT